MQSIPRFNHRLPREGVSALFFLLICVLICRRIDALGVIRCLVHVFISNAKDIYLVIKLSLVDHVVFLRDFTNRQVEGLPFFAVLGGGFVSVAANLSIVYHTGHWLYPLVV